MSTSIPEVFRLIPIERAEAQTLNWQTNSPGLKAFLFHRTEIEEVMLEPLSVNIRFYMGIKEVLGTPPPEESPYKMVVVGVDEFEKDILVESQTNSKIYDFALPCPRVCDDGSSPLMHSLSQAGRNESMSNKEGSSGDISKKVFDHLYEIPFSDAFDWTLAWQSVNSLKSVLFPIDDLLWLFDEYDAVTIRVYFAQKINGAYNFILVGVDIHDNDIIPPDNMVFASTVSPCSTESQTSCDYDSPLNHEI